MAQAKQERAIDIILSGTGSDGTGCAHDLGKSGMVIAQKAEFAEFDGLPLNVIATGQVDFELLPAEIPAKLNSLKRLLPGLKSACPLLTFERRVFAGLWHG